jgi:cytoskeletal protein CcmA (bactofilin family)
MFSYGDRRGPRAGGKSKAAFSFIGPEMTITGDIVSTGQLHIDGRVLGNIRCGVLSQSEQGEVLGNITADEARLAGLVDGTVDAGALILEAESRVTGDVVYETLSVGAGADVEGRFKRRRGSVGTTGVVEIRRAKLASPLQLFSTTEERVSTAGEWTVETAK